MGYPKASIIIPCRSIDNLVRESVAKCMELDYPSFEIIVLPDSDGVMEGVMVLPTGDATPGRKRNIGAEHASGDVLAFIDSDAYPRRDWLANAICHLKVDGVGTVGGPAITPPDDGAFAQAQGAMLSSALIGGNLAARYSVGVDAVETDDIHSVNLVAWRKTVEASGGWNEVFWPGEDTLLCLMVKTGGYRQVLASDVVVYHHRRPTWRGYLAQMHAYGLHRGYFVKKFPETSRRLTFFLPSVLFLWLISGVIISLFEPGFKWLYIGSLLPYVAVIAWTAIKNKHPLYITIGIPLTHMAYGVGFLRGLMTGRLKR